MMEYNYIVIFLESSLTIQNIKEHSSGLIGFAEQAIIVWFAKGTKP